MRAAFNKTVAQALLRDFWPWNSEDSHVACASELVSLLVYIFLISKLQNTLVCSCFGERHRHLLLV